MNKRPVWRTEKGGVNVGMGVVSWIGDQKGDSIGALSSLY